MKVVALEPFLRAGFICLLLLVTACETEAPIQANIRPLEMENSVKQFIQAWDHGKTPSYKIGFYDLNNDGIPEAIVYLTDSEWCGSGGCTTLILKQTASSWSIISKITITRLPIRVLPRTSNGWHDIGIWVQGGCIMKGYEAGLKFNGKKYPQNPSRITPDVTHNGEGEVVIPADN